MVAGYYLNGRHWHERQNVAMHLQLGSAGGLLFDGSPDWNAVAERSLTMWNSIISDATFQTVRDSTVRTERNGVNNVFWADDTYGEGFGDAVAVTISWTTRDPTRLAETDVLFNRRLNWDSYRGNQRRTITGQPLYDLQRVAIHEFGHALGLDHPDEHGQNVPAIMNHRVSDVDALQPDDAAGASAMYGLLTPYLNTDTLKANSRLFPGMSLLSANRRYRLVYQSDGNLVLYDEFQRGPVWATNTGPAGGSAFMQSDGNFAVYDAAGTARWATGTTGQAGARLVVQGDGNIVVYRPDGFPVWDRTRPAGAGSSPNPSPGTASLAGIVSSQDGARVQGASVRILDGANAGRSALTNSRGEYRFNGLTAANANLSATGSGYDERHAGVYINGVNLLNFVLSTRPLWSRSGVGNTAFDKPVAATRLAITGEYTGYSSNFVVWCGNSLLVNELLGTGWRQTRYDGTHSAPNCTDVRVTLSGGVAWSIREVR